jgi:predicted transcriptional regulator
MAREGRAIQYSVQAPISQVYVPVRHFLSCPSGEFIRPKLRLWIACSIRQAARLVVRLDLPNQNYALPAGLRCRIRFIGE